MTNVRSIKVPGQRTAAPVPLLQPTDDTTFWDVGGLPVALTHRGGCSEWSSGQPEPFSSVGIQTRGKQLTYRAWRDLITACRLGY